MHIAETGSTPSRRAPIAGGPTVEMLLGPEASDQVAVVYMSLPVGGGMPPHDHGASQVVLVPLSGPVELHCDEEHRQLHPGSVAHIATGERVSLTNPGTEPVSLIVVASPPDFTKKLTAWPIA